jgi:1-acyl-sn-glycerol-3-phosphate acyltransferase
LVILELRSTKQNSFLQATAKTILKMLSWRLDVNYPATNKYILIGAPHTSNWDLLFALLLSFGAGIPFNWVGKDSLFRWPLGSVLRHLGGIPVNRRERTDFVRQVADLFGRLEQLVIAITPEGTRSKVDYWKTGFYYIALQAEVPIALGYIDYKTRTVGIGPAFYPSGDLQSDFRQIQEFYADKCGKYIHKHSEIRLRPE